MFEGKVEREDCWDRGDDDANVGCDVEDGLRKGNIHQALCRACSVLGIARPSGDARQGKSVGKDADSHGRDDDTVNDRRINLEKDDEHGHLGDGRSD